MTSKRWEKKSGKLIICERQREIEVDSEQEKDDERGGGGVERERKMKGKYLSYRLWVTDVFLKVDKNILNLRLSYKIHGIEYHASAHWIIFMRCNLYGQEYKIT